MTAPLSWRTRIGRCARAGKPSWGSRSPMLCPPRLGTSAAQSSGGKSCGKAPRAYGVRRKVVDRTLNPYSCRLFVVALEILLEFDPLYVVSMGLFNLRWSRLSVFVTPTIQVPRVRTTFARPSAYLGEYASFVTYRWW